ncbi:outer membrane protein assembly factor BamB family protein [Halorubrum kocurii]|uniref:outer membrane protein assembly factor BamB family protein n=1 Tax=Halorubrum kocurii TaxID=478441 RepID=UPI0009B59ECB|nr:PQQ-binding-like beta-propeller repeat protein [Halorubrum kocurii]
MVRFIILLSKYTGEMKPVRMCLGIVVIATILLACTSGASAQSVGEPIWEQGEISEPGQVYETNDTIYIADGDATNLYAVDIETGGIKWRRSLPTVSDEPTQLVVGEDYVYLVLEDWRSRYHSDRLLVFDKDGNGLVWSAEFNDRRLSSTKIKPTDDGLLLFDTDDYPSEQILNFDKKTGEVTRSLAVAPEIDGEPEKVVLTSDYITVGNESSVSTINAFTGKVVWTQRYGTVGAVGGDETLHVVAGSDPESDEFTSHLISYDISSQRRTNDADFRYASTKAKIVHSDEVVLIRNREDDRIIGYNTTTGGLAYDVNQDTYDYSIGTSKNHFIAGNSFRDIKTGEQVATVDESIRFTGFRTPVGLTNSTAIVWGYNSNSDAEDSLIGVKSPVERESPPSVLSSPVTDPDSDGLYEDVNGDGDYSIVDVQALFANLDSDAVQQNPEKFDFNDDGSVTITDVQALFFQLS